eukprot:253899-Amphidinium_carterae.1
MHGALHCRWSAVIYICPSGLVSELYAAVISEDRYILRSSSLNFSLASVFLVLLGRMHGLIAAMNLH